MKAYRVLTLVALCSPLSLGAVAQTQTAPASEVKMATITGTVGKIAGNRFSIDTDKGVVLITTGPKQFHRLDLAVGERVTVTGEDGVLDFDAFQIKRADGTVTEIRPVEGPPPWVMSSKDGRRGPPAWAGRGDRGERNERPGPPPWAGRDDRAERDEHRGPPPWAGRRQSLGASDGPPERYRRKSP